MDLSVVDLSVVDLSVVDLSVVDLSVVDLSVVDLSVVDLAKDPGARANLETQPARSVQRIASESVPFTEPELLCLAYRNIHGGFKR